MPLLFLVLHDISFDSSLNIRGILFKILINSEAPLPPPFRQSCCKPVLYWWHHFQNIEPLYIEFWIFRRSASSIYCNNDNSLNLFCLLCVWQHFMYTILISNVTLAKCKITNLKEEDVHVSGTKIIGAWVKYIAPVCMVNNRENSNQIKFFCFFVIFTPLSMIISFKKVCIMKYY